jgi:hypothetical protein
MKSVVQGHMEIIKQLHCISHLQATQLLHFCQHQGRTPARKYLKTSKAMSLSLARLVLTRHTKNMMM